MSRLAVCALVAIAVAALTARDAAANLLLNGSFETDAVQDQPPIPGATDWTTFGNANTASAGVDPVRTGVGSLQLAGAGGFGVPGAYQTFPASPGQVWDLQGYMRTQEALAAGATFGLLKIVFGDGSVDLEPAAVNIGQAGPAANPGIEALPLLNSAATANQWHFTHAQGVAPAGTVEVRAFALFVDENAGTAYFDDLQLLLAGDFDSDLDVDGDDLVIWKAAFGTTAAGDADGDQASDGADFLLWQRAFTGASAPAVEAVPEPAAAVLLAAALTLAGVRGRKSAGT